MKNSEKAVISQHSTSIATQTALRNIVINSTSFLTIPGFILPNPKRMALSDELLHIIQQYNSMMNTLNPFDWHAPDEDQKRPSG